MYATKKTAKISNNIEFDVSDMSEVFLTKIVEQAERNSIAMLEKVRIFDSVDMPIIEYFKNKSNKKEPARIEKKKQQVQEVDQTIDSLFNLLLQRKRLELSDGLQTPIEKILPQNIQSLLYTMNGHLGITKVSNDRSLRFWKKEEIAKKLTVESFAATSKYLRVGDYAATVFKHANGQLYISYGKVLSIYHQQSKQNYFVIDIKDKERYSISAVWYTKKKRTEH